MNRFIVIVLDSFGVGAMEDVSEVRPQDIGSNTCLHLLKQHEQYDIKWDNLMELGLMNALGQEYNGYLKSDSAVYGTSKLKHYGADSFFGHQEISGTNPKKPIFHTLSRFIDEIEDKLIEKGLTVERLEKDGLQLLKVNNVICVGDNMETDLGQAINVVGALDEAGMDLIKTVGHIVREVVLVPRVIAFGGSNVSIEDIESAIITKKGEYIGIDAPGSGVYDTNYHVEHIGYGIDWTKQVPSALEKMNVKNYFYGKVSNIVYNPNGTGFDAVDTNEICESLFKDLEKNQPGFYFVNIQETDLAGHAMDSERYIDRLNVSDKWIGKVRKQLNDNDILIIMADHGNDPTIGHSRHTRERVPLLIDFKNRTKPFYLGNRETMADVGQTVAEYFGTTIEFGESFLNDIISLQK